MQVRECMTKQVELGSPDMSLKEVARKMREGDFGVLPLSENDRLVGVITDRDIIVRAIADGADPSSPVREFMTEQVLYCYDDQNLEEVTKNLGDNQIRRLPVLNRQKRLIGILSLGDISLAESAAIHKEQALSRISRHSQPLQNTHH